MKRMGRQLSGRETYHWGCCTAATKTGVLHGERPVDASARSNTGSAVLRDPIVWKVWSLRRNGHGLQIAIEKTGSSERGGPEKNDVEGREDAQGASHVKVLQTDVAGLLGLDKHQCRDEKSAQKKENRYAEPTRYDVVEPGM
jgi:hypothetical protein